MSRDAMCFVSKLRRQSLGFTLIELMVVVAITGILLMIAVPSFSDMILSKRLSSAADELQSTITFAKSEAIKRNTSVVVCASSNGTSCSGSTNWGAGWIVVAGASQALLVHGALPAGYRIWGNNTFSILSTGMSGSSTQYVICRADPFSSQQRTLTLQLSARTYVETTTGTTCPAS